MLSTAEAWPGSLTMRLLSKTIVRICLKSEQKGSRTSRLPQRYTRSGLMYGET